ncbi:MAG: hypothetical protein ABI325_01770 [Ginsengibacter sp.]
MQNEIYKITLTNLSKVSGLAGFYEHKAAFAELNEYLKSYVADNIQLQSTQDINFVVHVANGVLANVGNEITFQSMQYFVNLFIDKNYDYSAEFGKRRTYVFLQIKKEPLYIRLL